MHHLTAARLHPDPLGKRCKLPMTPNWVKRRNGKGRDRIKKRGGGRLKDELPSVEANTHLKRVYA